MVQRVLRSETTHSIEMNKKEINLRRLKLHYMLHGMGGSPIVPFGYIDYNKYIPFTSLHLMFPLQVTYRETIGNQSSQHGISILFCPYSRHYNQTFAWRSCRQVNQIVM